MLHVDLVALTRRGDDPRPTTHHLGRLTLTGDDRLRWRRRLADAYREAAAEADRLADVDAGLRGTDGRSSGDPEEES